MKHTDPLKRLQAAKLARDKALERANELAARLGALEKEFDEATKAFQNFNRVLEQAFADYRDYQGATRR